MSTATLVSLDEYLATSYRPDCDYVDGVLVERNLGQKDHGKLQARIAAWFLAPDRAAYFEVYTDMRVRVAETRCRVPDICVVELPEPDEQVFTTPPYICIEVLSPDDTVSSLRQRLGEILAFGVRNVWVIDPTERIGWRVTREGQFEALDGILRTTDGRIEMPIAELYRS